MLFHTVFGQESTEKPLTPQHRVDDGRAPTGCPATLAQAAPGRRADVVRGNRWRRFRACFSNTSHRTPSLQCRPIEPNRRRGFSAVFEAVTVAVGSDEPIVARYFA